MRIISGNLKSRRLLSVSGDKTRPILDKIKESIFNILSNYFEFNDSKNNIFVLDLFAGTGSLGIEALSRGAKFGLFVDSSDNAISVVKKNLEVLKIGNLASIIKLDITKNLKYISKKFSNTYFNLIFMDPPYDKGLILKTFKEILKIKIFTDKALFVIKHSILEEISNFILTQEFSCFKLIDTRIYGKTCISFLIYNDL